jgi:hypothetical protein
MEADAAHGLSRHFDAAQQPRRFRSKADINFGASSYRVYEYTAWLSWPARIIPHTWEIRTRCSMGSRNFSRGFVRCRAGSNFGNNSFHRCRRFYEAGSIGNGVNRCSNTMSLCEGVGAVPWPGGERGGGWFPDRFDGPGRAHPLWDEHLAAGTLVGHRHRVETLFP